MSDPKRDIFDDLQHLMRTLPMIDAQREIILAAISEIKHLRMQIDLFEMDRDRE